MGRKLVIGDIHGRVDALKEVLEKSGFDKEADKLILLGDIVDGGFNTNEVVNELSKIKNLVFVIGNHDKMFMDFLFKGATAKHWLNQGGANTLNSYGGSVVPNAEVLGEPCYIDVDGVKIPRAHVEFFARSKLYHVEDDCLFVHAGINPLRIMTEQDEHSLLWDRKIIEYAEKHDIEGFEKVFVGHTCLVKDSLIYTENGLCTIDNAVGIIYSILDKKLVKNKIINKWYKKEKVYKIYSNNIIEATEDHKLVVLRDGKQQFIKVSDLKKNDWLLVPKKLNIGGKKQLLKWYNKKYNKGLSINHPKYVNENVAYLLGVILGDGNTEINSISINEHYKKNLLVIQKILKETFGLKSNIFKRKNKNCYRIRINSIEFRNSMDIKNKTTYFLNLISKSKLNVRRSFIAGLIDSDGSINKTVTIYQKNKDILTYVQWMLLTDGIQSSVKETNGMSYGKKRTWYELRISSTFKNKIYEEYPLKYYNRKKKLLEATKIKSRNMKRYFNYGDFLMYDIKKIKYSGVKDVVDLEVDNSHTFIVNSICSHNSTQHIEREFLNFKCRNCGLETEEEATVKKAMHEFVRCPKCGSNDIFQSIGCTKPIKIGNLVCVDTGAGWDGRLTMLDIDSEKFYQSSLQEPPIK
jgi:serine/threonine protein phosphatase 1